MEPPCHQLLHAVLRLYSGSRPWLVTGIKLDLGDAESGFPRFVAFDVANLFKFPMQVLREEFTQILLQRLKSVSIETLSRYVANAKPVYFLLNDLYLFQLAKNLQNAVRQSYSWHFASIRQYENIAGSADDFADEWVAAPACALTSGEDHTIVHPVSDQRHAIVQQISHQHFMHSGLFAIGQRYVLQINRAARHMEATMCPALGRNHAEFTATVMLEDVAADG